MYVSQRKSWRLRSQTSAKQTVTLVFFEQVFESNPSTKPHEPNHFETTQRSGGIFEDRPVLVAAEAALREKWKPAHKGRRYHLAGVAVEVKLN